MHDGLLIFLMALIAGGIVTFYWVLQRRREDSSKGESLGVLVAQFQKEITDLRSDLHQQVLDLSRQVNEQLNHNSRLLVQTHQGYSEAVGQVQHRL